MANGKKAGGFKRFLRETGQELSAKNRQAMGELSQILQAFPTSGVQPVEVQGGTGSPTPGQLDETRREAEKEGAVEIEMGGD